jgi:exopolyphosphatase/guanosine-5'-triphosphate,3'-diphosphate pyrophosphatase
MPGFSAREQQRLALLVLGCRGSLDKVADALDDADTRTQILALRLAVLLHHARRPIDAPRITLSVGRTIRVHLAARWLKSRPLTAHLLAKEVESWAAARYAVSTKAAA